ncbi:PREDICTED: 14 kDa phosphohistidine phosphatase-like [Nicrophorus vespilloides]|uniref:14 kDa phosphohistidine phosphatase-like n=1 Tax=Nicrophorus vespilloides TaxID=110193 RepID=A0ABM1M9H0_NICVS|nr:PREDICTED: 14 kDa phosphohistidine phosphatase-like [Nicrophorus vespilloides]XP_017771219.1 PREDICTED: 14 kDa phosphohistidine phosphatase-like [Nicrophorus vespilloides]XP_017771220.1 PREDICTED: 14 kDa phosphohistidine phosphatase-like [Nicrophorus vespilloides]
MIGNILKRRVMSMKVPEVDIDASGVFKYILIRLQMTESKGAEALKTEVVRGYEECPYHSDISDKFTEQLQKLKQSGELVDWKTKVLGGGRINHDAAAKTIRVYGYSQGYGKADHQVTVNILKKVYKDYDITWSDEGY